jgi:hypothetical protein
MAGRYPDGVSATATSAPDIFHVEIRFKMSGLSPKVGFQSLGSTSE